jgi:hypothetical protein
LHGGTSKALVCLLLPPSSFLACDCRYAVVVD